MRMGAVGMEEIGAKGIAEIGAEGVARTSVTGAAGGLTVGIAVSAATFGSLKVSAIKRTDMQNELRLHREVMQIHIKGKRKKKAMTKGEEKV